LRDINVADTARAVAEACRKGPVTLYWSPKKAKLCLAADTAIDAKYSAHILGVYQQGVPESWVAEDVSDWVAMRTLQKARAA
jgi:hypothetical protein